MKKLLFPSLLLFAMLLLISCNQEKETDTGKQLGLLHISKSRPQPGDELQITYKQSADSISSEEKTNGYVYYIVNEDIYPHDLELKDSADTYTANFKIPDSVTAVAFNFVTNHKSDSNDKKGYAVKIYDTDGNPVPGSQSSLANFYEYPGSAFGIQVEKDSLLAAYKNDLETNPDLKNGYWGSKYAQELYAKDKEAGQKFTDDQIAEISNKDALSQDDYTQLSRLYAGVKNKGKEDSIKNIIGEKYPESEIAQQAVYMNFRQEKDLDKKEDILKSSAKNSPYKDRMLESLAETYLQKGDFDKFDSYSEQMSDKSARASAYNNIAWDLYQQNKNLDEAAKISKKSIDLIAEEQKNPKKPDYYTQSQYKNNLEFSSNMYMDTYAAILFKQGKNEEALNYQEKAVAGNKNSDPEMKQRYLQYLIANNEFQKAQDEAEEFVRNNNATSQSKEYLEQAYVKNKGSEKGYDAYISGLEKTAHQNAIAHLKKEMINEEAPGFTLTDLNGEKVDLAALKGKTVVVDFWATWCVPCKNSFPGMQKAVEKYKDSSDVQFLFVDTWESLAPGAREKEVKDFIANNNYDFHVLLDNPKEAGSNGYVTVDKFNVSGIPTKFVIDKNGKIRFKAVGFDGNTDKLAEEIQMMIDLAKS